MNMYQNDDLPRDDSVDAAAPADDDAVADVAQEVTALYELTREELEGQIELARAEIERLHDQLLRGQAELANFRRRAQKERMEQGTIAQVALLEELVPVVDDFERAAGAEPDDAGAYHEGVELILRRVQSVLQKIGVERFEPVGEVFDPRFHEAIARQDTDEVPEGQVVQVYQAGYRLRDRLIRPATVVVAYRGDNPGPIDATAVEGEVSTDG